MGRQDPVVGWEGRQGGLAHTQRHWHRLADLQGLVEGQSAQAVRVEVVWGEKRLGTQERWLKRVREEVIFSNSISYVLSVMAIVHRSL